jgi:hypothetical protein
VATSDGGAAASRRLIYAALLVTTVIAGLGVHFHGGALHPDVRDILGDVLWASMIYWLVASAAPSTGFWPRVIASLGICFAVEFSQLIQAEWLEAARSTSIGHLVLGSDYDSRDLLAYGFGAAAAGLPDRWLRSFA